METNDQPQIEGPVGDTPTAPAQSVEVVTDHSVSPIPKHENNNVTSVVSAQETVVAATQPIAMTSVVTQGGIRYIPTEQVVSTPQAVDLVTRERNEPVAVNTQANIGLVATEHVAAVQEVPAEQVQTQVVTAQQSTSVVPTEHAIIPAAQQVAVPGPVGVALSAHQPMHVHPVQLHTPTIIHVPSSDVKPGTTPAVAHVPVSYPSVITQHITQPSVGTPVPSVVTSIQNVMPAPQDQLAANAALLTQQLAAAGMLPIKAQRLDTATKVYVSDYSKVGSVLNPALYASPALYTQQVVASSGQFPVKSETAINTATATPLKLYTSTPVQAENPVTSQGALFAQQVASASSVPTKVTTTEPQVQPANVGLSAALLMQQLAAGVLGYQLRGDLNQQTQLALAGITSRPADATAAATHQSPGLGLYSNQVSTITTNPTVLTPQTGSETKSQSLATPSTGGILPSLFTRPPGTLGMFPVASTPSQQLQSSNLVTNPAQLLYNIANSTSVPQFKAETTTSQSHTVNPASTQPVLTAQSTDIGLYPVKIQPLNPINGDEVEVQTETTHQSLPSVNTLSTEGTSIGQEEVKSKMSVYQTLDSTTCVVCGKTFKSRNNLKVHLRSHSGEKPYSCSSCGRCFTQSSSLNRHAKIHKKKYKCKYCDTSFTKKRYLKEHKRTHKLEKRAKIAVGEQIVGQQIVGQQIVGEQIESVQEVHQMAHEMVIKTDPYVSAETRTLEKPFKCPQCHITFALSVDLRQHVGTHIGQKPVPVACRWCSKEFQHSWDLKCHERTHHNVQEIDDPEAKPKMEACRWCGQEFQHSWDLKCHEASHHLAVAEEPVERVPKDPAAHVCQFCHKSFTRRGVLKRHERIHTGERPYVCPHCKKGFAVGNNLKQHIRTHTGEKPYSCETCGRAFAQGSSLKRHQAIHEKDGIAKVR